MCTSSNASNFVAAAENTAHTFIPDPWQEPAGAELAAALGWGARGKHCDPTGEFTQESHYVVLKKHKKIHGFDLSNVSGLCIYKGLRRTFSD